MNVQQIERMLGRENPAHNACNALSAHTYSTASHGHTSWLLLHIRKISQPSQAHGQTLVYTVFTVQLVLYIFPANSKKVYIFLLPLFVRTGLSI